MIYDAIVIGAGPSGSSAAYFLAKNKLNTLLIEKDNLPRHKPCGGAVPRTVIESYPFFSNYNKALIPLCKVGYSFRGNDFTEKATNDIKVYSVERKDFDHHIVCEARKAGCLVESGHKAVSLEESEKKIIIKTAKGLKAECRYCVIASGSLSTLPIKHFPRNKRKSAFALATAARLYPDESIFEAYRGKVHIDFAFIKNGYAGIIPKADYLSLCLYQRFLSSRNFLIEKTDEFKKLITATGALTGFEVRVFSIYDQHRNLNTKRIFLAGDAATLVDSLSGEGIKHAIKSGKIAAETIVHSYQSESEKIDYSERIRTEIGKELITARKFLRMAHLFPKITYGGLVNVSEEAGNVLNGTLSYGDLLDRLRKRLIRKLGSAFLKLKMP